MQTEFQRRPRLRPNAWALMLTGFSALLACGLPAYAQQVPQGRSTPPDARLTPTHAAAAAAPPSCAPVQHWDAAMQMCAANDAAALQTMAPPNTQSPDGSPRADGTPASSTSGTSDRSMNSSMSMDTPSGPQPKTTLMIHLNQFMVYSSTSGPRGKSRLTGPGYWMLTYGNDLTPTNHFSVDVMGSPEQLTVGDKGTPQLLQTDHIDNMHAHDTIMAFEVRDALAIGTDNNQQLTFMFAPRGEAAIGPVPFMHRESAEGNPDAPLGHSLQDGFHDASTVLGVEYRIARTTAEFTAFSGQNITSPFPLHRPDSYAVRLNQDIDGHVGVGASFADVLLPGDTGGAEHNQFISAWLTTTHKIHEDTLKSSFIVGSARAGHGAFLNSLLEEAVYQRGRNNFYGRAEVLQITPAQLELTTPSGAGNAKWVKALTIGYERSLFEKNALRLLVGGSYTKDFVPAAFQPAYGSDPGGVKIYLRLKFMATGPGF